MSSCENTPNKRIYTTHAKAKKRAKLMQKIYKKRQYVYHCPSCGFYHLTTNQPLDGVWGEQNDAIRRNQRRSKSQT